MKRSTFALLVVVGLLAGVTAACGDDDDDTGASAATTTASTGTGATTTSAAPEGPQLEKASGPVRGFDGTTITVASLGIKAQFPTLELGVQARLKRFNDTNEIPGIKVAYAEYADSKVDPAVTLTETRRLVTSVKIFGIVGNFSATNSGDYLKQEQVPVVGSTIDATACSTTDEPSLDVWHFGPVGCQTNPNPPEVPDDARLFYDLVKEKTGKAKPTLAIIGTDAESGKNSVNALKIAAVGTGFDVVYSETQVPSTTPVSDYTPYAQALLTSASGGAPDAIVCRMPQQCIGLWATLKGTGYKGSFFHFLYSDTLLQPMAGTYVQTYQVAFNANTPALQQLATDVKAVKPDAGIETAVWQGYVSADIFIQALTELAEKGKEYITPANLQKVLSQMTWEVDGLGGPVKYPESTVITTPQCMTLMQNEDGTAWETARPYSCSDKTFPNN